MQRVAIVGDGPAALSTAERLIGAGMCVDLVCAKPTDQPEDWATVTRRAQLAPVCF